jgi:polar amino acid transport system substrate-binding protein
MGKRLMQACLVMSGILLFNQQASAFDCGPRPIKLAFFTFGMFYDEQGRGIDKDIVDELKRRTNCAFDTQVMPRARIWADLASGQLDMSVSGIQTPERNRFAWFAHYMAVKNYALINTTLAASIKNPEQFLLHKDAQFGAVRSFKHGAEQDAFLEQMREQSRVQDSADLEALYSKLRQGRVQGIFSQPPVFRAMLGKLNMTQQVQIQDWAPQQKGVPHGLILAKASFTDQQAQAWQAQISAMAADGTLRKIYHRYLSDAEVNQLLDF